MASADDTNSVVPSEVDINSLKQQALDTLSDLVGKHKKLEQLENTQLVVCYECSKPLERPMMCSRCHFVNYCSRECQLKNWKSEHSIQCKHVIPLLVAATAQSKPNHKIVLRSPKWGIHMIATHNIQKGDLIWTDETPLLFVCAFKRQEIQEDMTTIQQRMLLGEKKLTDIICYDDKVFGRDFPCKSTRSRMTYLLLVKHTYLIESHFFETGLLGDEVEQQEIKALLEYLCKRLPKEAHHQWTLEQVAFAYCMMRQCNVEFLENVQNRSFIGEAFSPTVACMNHSCAANSMLFYGDSGRLYLFATRDIASGEQIFRDYINNNCDVLYWDSRRRMLKSRFHFICKCDRCEAEYADALVPKKQSHPETKDPEEAKKPRLPYVDQNIPSHILAKLLPAEKDPDYVKAIVLSLEHDQELKRYLFQSDWSLLYSLISDCMRYELAKNFGAKKQEGADCYDVLSKSAMMTTLPTVTTRQIYISIIEEFLVEFNLSTDARIDTNTGKNTHKRVAIFHVMRICLILFGYLTELVNADKQIENDAKKDASKSNESTFYKIPIWYHYHYCKIVSQEDRSKIETSLDALTSLFHDRSSQIYGNRSMILAFLAVDIITAPHIFSVFNYYIYQIESMLVQERLFNARSTPIGSDQPPPPPPTFENKQDSTPTSMNN